MNRNKKRLAHSCAPLLALLIAATAFPVQAAEYVVDAGENLTATGNLNATVSDTITLTGDPAALTSTYNLKDKPVIIQSSDPAAPRTIQGNNTLILIQVYDGNTVTLDNIILTGGTTVGSNDGGAIRATGGAAGSTTTIKGRFTATNNASNRHGGAISVNNGGLTLEDAVTFVSNTAAMRGGAINSNNHAITIKDTAVFSNNTADTHGGAIYTNAASGTVILESTSTFSGNRTHTYDGGAIYSRGDISIAGNSTFENNSAGRNGGAIYYDLTAGTGTITLDAALGDIVFKGNTHRTASAPVPNALSMRTSATTTPVLYLDTGTGLDAHAIMFYDPIATSAVSSTAAIKQVGDGAVIFDTGTSIATATTTIESGNFRVARGAMFGSGNNRGSFTLKASGTLSGNGAVLASEITLENGATLEVHGGGLLQLTHNNPLAGATGLKLLGSGTLNTAGAVSVASISVGTLTPDDPAAAPLANTAQTLTLAPSTPLTLAANATIAIDMFGGTDSDQLIADTIAFSGPASISLLGDSGTYTILTANNSTFLDTDFIFLVNGIAPTARYAATPTVNSINSGAGSELVIDFSKKNLGITWTGDAPGGIWKHSASTDANWTDAGAAPENFFQNGDSVSFTDAATNKSVSIDAAGVIVAGMTVDIATGAYTVAGAGGITGSTTDTVGGLVTPTGKLTKTGAGALNFENTAANNFVSGIDISGGVIGFTSGDQLGDGGNGIHFTGDATLSANADDATLANKLIVDADKTATLDTAGHTLTYAGDLAGVAATGTLAKAGDGVLKLTTDHSGYAASTLVSQGRLNLATAAAALGGRIDIASGGILSGIGSATGSVVAAPGAIIEIGVTNTAPETLAINDLSLNDATIRFDLYAGGLSDQLNITGALTQSGVNTIDISSFVTGTYNLGSLTALSSAQVYIGGIAQPPGARQTAVLSTSGGSLILVAGADMSRALSWTGVASGTWTPADSNWTDGAGVTLFAGGDRVIFDGASDSANPANRSIEIAGNGMSVSDMIVQGDANYTFAGAGINADAATVISGVLTDATGKLLKAGSGTLAFTNAANTFKGGIELAGGAVTFTNASQLGDGGNGIRFTGDATLAPAAGALTLAVSIDIDPGKTATLDTAAYSLTLAGAFSPAASGTLVKTGTGKLTLTGDSAASASLATNVDSGALLLDGGALGGTVNVATGAIFGGAGGAPGPNSVRAAAGSIIQAGLDAPGGILDIANLQLAASSTLTGKGTLTGAATLDGVVAAFVNAGDSLTLSGSNTGPGGILKTGAGNLVYTAASALGYAGGTQIDEGYVMLRGITGADAAGLSHTITLNGGWLDLSDAPADPALSGSTANNWLGLDIVEGANASAGGVIGVNDFVTLHDGAANYAIGSGPNQGVFVVVDAGNGVAELTGSNGYKGYTRIDSGTLRVTDGAQLGDTTLNREVILNGGALQISAAFDTARALELRADGAVTTDAGVLASWDSVSGAFAFTKAGSGTLVIANASTAASTEVLEGRYVTGNTGGGGDGPVTVADGATIEYLELGGGVIPNRFTGAGALAITGGAATLGSAGIDIARLDITRSEVTLQNSAQATAITLDAARLNLGAPITTLGDIAMGNGSTLAFAFSGTAGTAFKRATINSLTGGGSLLFSTNLGAGRGDELTLTNAPSGDYDILINNTGAAPVGFTAPIVLITAPGGGNATFAIPGGKIDVGMYSYEIQSASQNGSFIVSLAGSGALSDGGAIINGMAGALPLSWFSELDTVHQRMGELRFDTNAGKGGASTWMRGYGQAINFNTKVTGVKFTERQTGIDAGADYRVRGDGLDIYFGAFVGYGRTERRFDSPGDGSAESIYGGAYGTLATPGGWYVDGVLKANTFKNRFSTRAVTGDTVSGDYDTRAFGGSLEAGKNIRLGKGWYVEPQAQAAYTILAGNKYTASTGLDIEVEWGSTAQLRAGLMAGRAFTTGYGENFQVYAKAHAISQWTTDGGIIAAHANGVRQRFSPTIKGDSFEYGGGIAWMPGRSTQIFFDFETANASRYKKPWGVNLGLRHGW